MKTILFVDDETQILKAIGRIFIETGYKILLAENAEEGLRILARTSVDMIVSDMRMPGMDGIELLKNVRTLYPHIVRIILSGYADENEILYTLQTNLAKAYMFKPWNNDELLRVICENLIDTDKTLPPEVIAKINNLEYLPTVSKRYDSIRRAINEQKDIAIISAQIEQDQTVTAKLLQIVNSAYYGVPTASVKKALSMIGVLSLQELLLSVEMVEALQITGDGCHIAEKIWKHASCTNKIQHIIQEHFLHKKDSHTDATAGLLHKIGIVFMIKYYRQQYIDLLDKALKNDGDYLGLAENKTYGFSHQLLSAYLLRWWNAPAQMVEVAACYDNPFDEAVENKTLACVIHIAQHYASIYLQTGLFCPLIPETFNELGIEQAAFEAEYITLVQGDI